MREQTFILYLNIKYTDMTKMKFLKNFGRPKTHEKCNVTLWL